MVPFGEHKNSIEPLVWSMEVDKRKPTFLRACARFNVSATESFTMIELDKRKVPLEIEAETFRRIGYQMIDRIALFLENIRERPVTPAANADQIRARLKAETRLPEQGQSPETLLAKAADLLFHFSLLNGHPRFWGYVTSSAAPIGCLADLLAAAVNPNVGAWKLAPVATEIELQTIRWIAELIGFPHGTGGLLVSGGNMANFVGFLVGRHSKISSWPSETEGKEVPHFAVYASSETHTWIEKAIDLFGAGMTSLRWVRTDDDQRIDLSELERQIEEDLRGEIVPFMVVGNAGTVGTGAVDPLRELAVICKKHQLWFHVDGAYGALAAVVPGLKAQFDGIDKADSL